MNTRIEHLLRPVSVEAPCGPDLSNSQLFGELETLVRGKPEIEYGSKREPAEPPDWKKLAEKSAEYLGQSKDLRAAVYYCCALLKTDELNGFCDGLELIRGLVVEHWPQVYPLLDPEDGNDPTQRLNILSPLTRGRGNKYTSGWLAFADHLHVAPILRVPGSSPVTYERLLLARAGRTAADGAAARPAEVAEIDAALKGAGGERVAAGCELLRRSAKFIEEIDGFLTATLGASNSIDFDALTKMLQEMIAVLQPAAGPEAAAVEKAAPGAIAGPAGGAVQMVTGPIRSRADVVRTLEAVCAYYQQAEPGSPVPYLLKRAQKLATMNFVEALQELALATPEALRPSMGSTIGAPAEKS